MGLFKNESGQQLYMLVVNRTTGAPVLGAGGTLSVTASRDGAAFSAVSMIIAERQDGIYVGTVPQADTNHDSVVFSPVSSDPNFAVIVISGANGITTDRSWLTSLDTLLSQAFVTLFNNSGNLIASFSATRNGQRLSLNEVTIQIGASLDELQPQGGIEQNIDEIDEFFGQMLFTGEGARVNTTQYLKVTVHSQFVDYLYWDPKAQICRPVEAAPDFAELFFRMPADRGILASQTSINNLETGTGADTGGFGA